MRAIREDGISTLLIYEPRGYYCSPNCSADEELSRWSTDFHSLGNCQDVLSKWKSEGYQNILVNESGIDFFLKENDPNHPRKDLTALKECLGRLSISAEFGSAYRLYEIK